MWLTQHTMHDRGDFTGFSEETHAKPARVKRTGVTLGMIAGGSYHTHSQEYSYTDHCCNICRGQFLKKRGQDHSSVAWGRTLLAWPPQAFVTNSLMNPIWMVKTRMQLEKKAKGEKKMNALQCARYVYKMEGIRGFYRGLTASYAGISETMICFLIYETLKKHLSKSQFSPNSEKEKGASDFLSLMLAAAFSKGCASCIAYPHEVIRTRLREEGSKYKYFFQTGRLVAVEEGYAAFYRGLIPQLIRQIPNTAIVLSTYELIVHLLGDSK